MQRNEVSPILFFVFFLLSSCLLSFLLYLIGFFMFVLLMLTSKQKPTIVDERYLLYHSLCFFLMCQSLFESKYKLTKKNTTNLPLRIFCEWWWWWWCSVSEAKVAEQYHNVMTVCNLIGKWSCCSGWQSAQSGRQYCFLTIICLWSQRVFVA